jgi:hypothetical protein
MHGLDRLGAAGGVELGADVSDVAVDGAVRDVDGARMANSMGVNDNGTSAQVHQPFAGTAQFQACAVHQEMHRFGNRSWSRNPRSVSARPQRVV